MSPAIGRKRNHRHHRPQAVGRKRITERLKPDRIGIALTGPYAEWDLKKNDAIREVKKGVTVNQIISIKGGNDPERSKRIVDRIPDQLFVGEPRIRVKQVEEHPSEDVRGLIEEVRQRALGSGPLTPIVADALKIARTLKKNEESTWLERELYGYETRPIDQPNTFPEYRRVPAKIHHRLEAVTITGPVTNEFVVDRTLFVSFSVMRIEDTVNGARSRDAVELVFWMKTPKEYLDLAKEQKAQIASENPGKTPFIVQISDLERLLSELRLRIHRFVTAA